jgi:hypothetical protein
MRPKFGRSSDTHALAIDAHARVLPSSLFSARRCAAKSVVLPPGVGHLQNTREGAPDTSGDFLFRSLSRPAQSFDAGYADSSSRIDNVVGGVKDSSLAEEFPVFRTGELVVGPTCNGFAFLSPLPLKCREPRTCKSWPAKGATHLGERLLRGVYFARSGIRSRGKKSGGWVRTANRSLGDAVRGAPEIAARGRISMRPFGWTSAKRLRPRPRH